MDISMIILLLVACVYVWARWDWVVTDLLARFKEWRTGIQVDESAWEEVTHDDRFTRSSSRGQKPVTIDLEKGVSYWDVTDDVAEITSEHSTY